MNFAFAGTPDFAAWVLEDLGGLGRRPALVVSQPDRPRGRGRLKGSPPAVVAARRLGLECVQTDDIDSPESLARLNGAGVSALVVAAFGQILHRPSLDSFLCLNVHASLLPKYRGAAPVERALEAGEPSTGVSIMRMTAGLDEGPWALQKTVQVKLDDDAGSVGRSLATLGAAGIDEVLAAVADGTVRWTEQQGPSSYAPKLTARDCLLDPDRVAKGLHDQVRSLSPSLGARAACGTVEFKVWRTWPYGQAGLEAVPDVAREIAGAPGRVAAGDGRLFLGCAEGVVEILTVQPAGKAKMETGVFLRGYGARLGDCLARVSGSEQLSRGRVRRSRGDK